ncbi:hypothetical protein niasHT_020830 [Heterodera trifolii]|uniref:Phosphatidylinositol transfer protein N-terminal domain-containing protein n=1 Tax=Heterodera trifolii TaxID=157864 RepID=A0ABD2KLI5_9BILA
MMQQNAFATDLRLRCNHPDCLRKYVLDMVGSLRSHVSSHHGADHNRHTNRKPNAPGLVLVLSKTDPNPAGVIAGAGRTAVYTVYRCMRVGARPLTVTFPHDNDARMGYVSALERAQMLLGLHHLPPLAIRRWPYAHAFGPSGSAAIPCAVVSLMTNRLCRSDTAVSVNVDVFTDLLFGVVFMAAKAHVRQLHPLGAGHAGPGDLGGVAGGGHGWTDSGVRRHGAAAAGRDVQAFAGEEHPTAIWPLQCRVHNSAQSGFRQKILSDSCITDREASNDISFVEFGLLEERGDVEERIQVVRDNKPFESQNLCNGRFTSGHFSHKIYHFNSKKLPSLLRRLLPKGSMNVHEKVWNAFPYWKEELTNPDFMKDNFMIRMETMLLSDRGTTKNIKASCSCVPLWLCATKLVEAVCSQTTNGKRCMSSTERQQIIVFINVWPSMSTRPKADQNDGCFEADQK